MAWPISAVKTWLWIKKKKKYLHLHGTNRFPPVLTSNVGDTLLGMEITTYVSIETKKIEVLKPPPRQLWSIITCTLKLRSQVATAEMSELIHLRMTEQEEVLVYLNVLWKLTKEDEWNPLLSCTVTHESNCKTGDTLRSSSKVQQCVWKGQLHAPQNSPRWWMASSGFVQGLAHDEGSSLPLGRSRCWWEKWGEIQREHTLGSYFHSW